MRTIGAVIRPVLVATLLMGGAVDATAQVEGDPEWTRRISESVEALDAWVRNAESEKAKADTLKCKRDAAYLEHWFSSFWLGNLELSVDGTYTNVDEWRGGPGLGVGAPTEIDQDSLLYGAQIGWSDKPLLRDLYLLRDAFRGCGSCETGSKHEARFPNLARYRNLKDERGLNGALRWALLDAFKLTAGARYGSVIDDPSGADNSTKSQRGSYFVGFSYEIPLEKVGHPFVE